MELVIFSSLVAKKHLFLLLGNICSSFTAGFNYCQWMVVGCHTVLKDFYLYSSVSMKCKWQIGTLFNCDFSNKGYLLKNYLVREFKLWPILKGFGFRVAHTVMWFVSFRAPYQNAACWILELLATVKSLTWTLSESEGLGTFWADAVSVADGF